MNFLVKDDFRAQFDSKSYIQKQTQNRQRRLLFSERFKADNIATECQVLLMMSWGLFDSLDDLRQSKWSPARHECCGSWCNPFYRVFQLSWDFGQAIILSSFQHRRLAQFPVAILFVT